MRLQARLAATKEPAMLETIEIDDPRAARPFTVPRQRRILLSLIPQARSLSELSRLTDTPLNLLHHHVARFLRLGLVTMARQQPRAGAPIKYYRANARSFVVPAELMASSPGAGMAGQLREQLDRSLSQAVTGFVFTHDDQGPRMRPRRDPELRARAAELWLDLRLSDADAELFSRELSGLLHRFEARAQPSQPRYIVHAAFAPVAGETRSSRKRTG
ncbi:winged helix-turn-helix domain-containing protein [Phenylobacterium sp.]|uniref:winged helix-turn-helix domain-containing protein n=1 Tax=Phenylobacterium sp. TaxID=1871053 RepID=UPI002DF657A2|nr:winged helix-turn-helix domain-containing protein [Phenylobacterium sp.]